MYHLFIVCVALVCFHVPMYMHQAAHIEKRGQLVWFSYFLLPCETRKFNLGPQVQQQVLLSTGISWRPAACFLFRIPKVFIHLIMKSPRHSDMCLLCQHTGGRSKWISVISRLACPPKQIPGQPRIHCEACLETNTKTEINIEIMQRNYNIKKLNIEAGEMS